MLKPRLFDKQRLIARWTPDAQQFFSFGLWTISVFTIDSQCIEVEKQFWVSDDTFEYIRPDVPYQHQGGQQPRQRRLTATLEALHDCQPLHDKRVPCLNYFPRILLRCLYKNILHFVE